MAIKAIAIIVSNGVSIYAGTPPVYSVVYTGFATDGVSTLPFGAQGPTGANVLIPLDTNFKHANELIRRDMAANILAVTGWTIDPDDIYIPLS